MNKDLDQLYKVAPLYKELFAEQLQMAISPSKYVAALCSRRAGKTKGILYKIFQDLLSHPGTLGLYLALTDKSVLNIVFPIVREIISKCNVKAKISGDEIVFDNGSTLAVLGANHVNKIEGFRGTKLLFCVIDEAASFNERILSYLIDEIVDPALIDLRGQLILAGTPASHCQGMFYDITTKKEGIDVWKVYKWTAFDNPYVKDSITERAEIFLKRKQCDRTHPKFRREYLGEWCADDEALMIKPFALVHPPGVYNIDDWRSVIGVDFGFNDETAFSVIAWQRHNPKSYILETFGVRQASVSEIGNILKRLKETYKPISIVGDPAGASKIMMAEFLDKYKIVMTAAQKTNKAHYIEILNDALINCDLVLHPTQTIYLQSEMKKVVWNEDRTRELEGMKCDQLDATLYAYREALAYTEKIKVVVVETDKDRADKWIKQQIVRDQERFDERQGDTFFNDIHNFLD